MGTNKDVLKAMMKKALPSYRFILSGGGTGGHIFPALAIAEALRARHPSASFLFVGALGRMEMRLIPEAGFSVLGLWIGGWQRRFLWRHLLLPLQCLVSMWQAYRALLRFRPHAVVGTGGYATVPMLCMAILRRLPTLIHEPNAYAGKANRLLGAVVNKVCVSYEGMERYFPSRKITRTGTPLRQGIFEKMPSRAQALRYFELEELRPVLFVMGGSLGAGSLNACLLADLPRLAEKGIQLLWQVGHKDYEALHAQAQRYAQVRVYAFIKPMAQAYTAAHVIISRAGALAIAELLCVRKPTILVPSPNVANNHQFHNAAALAGQGAVCLVRDEHIHQTLFETALDLLENKDLQARLVARMGQQNPPASPTQASNKVCDEIEQLIPKAPKAPRP